MASFFLAVSGEVARSAEFESTGVNDRIQVIVFKKGLFSAFAHDHHFEVTNWKAQASSSEEDPKELSIDVVLKAGSLRDRERALSDSDLRKVDAQAVSPDGLDAAKFPEIRWHAERIAVDPGRTASGPRKGTARGLLTVKGRTHPVDVTFEAEPLGDGFEVNGKARFKQSDFGIRPYSGFGGTVAVKDEVELNFDFTLRRTAR